VKEPFFPLQPDINPRIYAYEDLSPQYEGLLKIGYTIRNVEERVAQQYPIKRPGEPPYRIVLDESAMRNDGSSFSDRDVHKVLRRLNIANPDGEWFRCDVKNVQAAILSLVENVDNDLSRSESFIMRPEQIAAVNKTAQYFRECTNKQGKATSHFLWNAKMRFGKTFATYQLAKEMGWHRILVLTFKPAVMNAWEQDLNCHLDFTNWLFISKNTLDAHALNNNKSIVCFGSFQDFLGKNKVGGIKAKNEWVHAAEWDCVVLDEYHYGAWRENAKELFEAEDAAELRFNEGQAADFYSEEMMPIKTRHYLYLSGTPFKALASGEFIEEQIYNWTYSDEQRAKQDWNGPHNPYEALPRMVLMTYQLPDSIAQIAQGGEFNEFDLNIFFSAKGAYDEARFTYQDEVQKWLDLIRGAYLNSSIDNLKLGSQKPPLPFSDKRLLSVLGHTFWFLPTVASCYAMEALLHEPQNSFYHQFKVIPLAGPQAGIGADALKPVIKAMDDPLKTKTITLSCGKLTTGVSVKPWTGIFMLRNCSSPETYFQAAFRVQTPWVVKNSDGRSPNEQAIIKKDCYVFDFAPQRALTQIASYSCRLNVTESNPESKVEEFIKFLPVLAYDGSSMKQINASGILDFAMSGTSATLLARRWESALLVNVDNLTLQRLLDNPNAIAALSKIEGFRTLNYDLQTIINKADSIKKAKTKASEVELTEKEKKELSEDEKEYKSKRKLVQEKLIKFATRIPIFMYLTDYREYSLKDIIMKLEPDLFLKVTGLTVDDFDLLLRLNIFNSALMNDAIYKFKRYEDSSLKYSGISKHKTNKIGLFDTVIDASDILGK
jgi:hypothetical protein